MREFSFRFDQVTGPALDPKDFPSVNQRRNIGGSTVGIVGVISACLPGQPEVMTTETYPTFTQADQAVSRWLERLYGVGSVETLSERLRPPTDGELQGARERLRVRS